MGDGLMNTLTPDQRRALDTIRAAAGRIWARPLHRYYTDHTPQGHSTRVIALLDGLTAGMMVSDKRLAPGEAFVLLAAAYLHDIGMQNERFAGGDLDDIRDAHAEQTAEMIYAVFEDRANAVSIPLGDDPTVAEAVALVAKGHRRVDLAAAAYDPLVYGEETLRLRLLAALLRFADELDIDYRRVDLEQMKLLALPLESQLHWWKCHYVSGVSIRDETIKIAYRFPQDRPDYAGLIVPLVEGDVRARHAELEGILRAEAVKVALGKSQVRLMRLVQPLPPEVEQLAREKVESSKGKNEEEIGQRRTGEQGSKKQKAEAEPAPPARPAPAVPDEDLSSLQRQLAEARENLRLIQERKAEFVLSTDVPLQLVKEERQLLDRIAELEQQVAARSSRRRVSHAARESAEPARARPERCIYKGKEYVTIPTGPFRMGSPPDRVKELNEMEGVESFGPEAPQHRVHLDAFIIARYPVTNAEYQAFVRATGQRVPYRDDDWSQPFNWDPATGDYPEGKGDHPVVLVSWHDAQAYCAWLGGRLPTEAEWEKAARGGDGREWPWGNTWQEGRCNTAESGFQSPTAVGAFLSRGDSPYGVGDMAGNVWEWCSSLRDPYPYRAGDGREEPVALGQRVLRGGAWGLGRWLARCAFRGATHPDDYGFSIGFRVVLVGHSSQAA